MDMFVGLFIILFLWVLVGSGCITVWGDAFDDIESRKFRVSARILMLVLWPAWLVLWAICVAIGITFMILRDLFK